MSKILPRTKYYEDQILRWTIYYDEQNITMTKILRWTKQYDEHNNTMNKILWWTKYYDEQNITTNNILRWPKYYDEQNITMNKYIWLHLPLVWQSLLLQLLLEQHLLHSAVVCLFLLESIDLAFSCLLPIIMPFDNPPHFYVKKQILVKKCYTVETFPKFDRKIVERGN